MKRSVVIKGCDGVVLTAVFLLTASYIGSVITASIIPEDAVRNNANYWYPLWTAFDGLTISAVLLWKAFRLPSCGFTKISVVMYSILAAINMFYVLFPFSYTMFSHVMIRVILTGLLLLIIFTYVFLWLRKQKST